MTPTEFFTQEGDDNEATIDRVKENMIDVLKGAIQSRRTILTPTMIASIAQTAYDCALDAIVEMEKQFDKRAPLLSGTPYTISKQSKGTTVRCGFHSPYPVESEDGRQWMGTLNVLSRKLSGTDATLLPEEKAKMVKADFEESYPLSEIFFT